MPPRSISILLTCILISAFTATSPADTWLPPWTFKVASKDGNYRLTVTPSNGKRVPDPTKRGSGPVAPPKAVGKLERKTTGGVFRVVWEHPLVNDVSPVSALVANDGTAVTLDNWGSVGIGPDVVVVYAPDGKKVRSMGLKDFVPPNETDHLVRSVSSIWWGRGHHFDDKQEILILNVGNDNMTISDKPPTTTVRLRLSTGEIVKEESNQLKSKEAVSRTKQSPPNAAKPPRGSAR